MAVVKTVFASDLLKGSNSLKVWSTGGTPTDLIKIKVFHSDEAGVLAKSVEMPGTLGTIARPVTLDNANWSEEGATNDADFRNPNGMFNPGVVDPAGALTIANTDTGDFCQMTAAELNFYKYFDGVLRSVKSLKQVSGGIIDSGEWHILDGYWSDPPSVSVFAVDNLTFHRSYVAQSQKVRIGLTDIEQVSSGKFRIKGDSFLESQDGSALVAPGSSCSGGSSANTSSYTLPANTRKLTANIRMSGYCGEWFDGDYNRCRIQMRSKLVYYTNGAWLSSSWSSIYTVSSSYSSITISTPISSNDITSVYLSIAKTANTRSEISSHNGGDNVSGVLDNLTCSLSGGAVITTGSLGFIVIGD